MEAYTGFAQVYDILMDETPYAEWAQYLQQLIAEYGISKPVRSKDKLESERNLILDLGCGTGTMSELFYQAGFDVIGVDNSNEMLELAVKKKDESGSDILYLKQDMRELDLYCTVGTVISVCDSVNYLLEEEDLLATFKLVQNYLYPQGIFIFDFNTVYKYRDVMGDMTIAENRDDCSFIWENYYHSEEEINEYDLTIFAQNGSKEENRFQRFSETHYQRGYTLDQMKHLVEQASMECVKAIDADTHEEAKQESERIYIIARKRSL